MNKAYFASNTYGKCLFLEPYIDWAHGDFDKYVNNNGLCLPAAEGDEDRMILQAKAEAFVHYSYSRCGKVAMVFDIQGCGYIITDPEVATTSKIGEKRSGCFAVGTSRKKQFKTS